MHEIKVQFSSVQLLSRVWLFATPWTAAHQASLSFTNSRSPPKSMSIESVMPSNHLILCLPLLLLPSIFPSIRNFSNESTLRIRWPKYWSFSFNISPSNEHPGLISFRMDWLDLLAVQGILKNLLQHHSSKASSLQCSAFFIVQLSHPFMTTGKTIALTRRTFVGKAMSLLFNMVSRLVITFLPRSKRLLISWLQSPSAVILEPQKTKSATVSTVSPPICLEVVGPDAMILVSWMLSFKPTFSLSSFTFIKRLFSSSSVSAIRVVSSAYLRLLIFLPAILIPACAEIKVIDPERAVREDFPEDLTTDLRAEGWVDGTRQKEYQAERCAKALWQEWAGHDQSLEKAPVTGINSWRKHNIRHY